MTGEHVGIRAVEWPLIVLIAVAVAVPTAFAPLYALIAAAVLIVLGFVVFNAGALLLLMVAAFPWDDVLGFPTETISIIKLLGALLLIGYALRSLARDEDVRLPPTLPALVLFTMLVLLSLMASGDVGSGLSKTLRYLLFAAFSFLVVQLIRSRPQLATLLRVLVLSSTLAALYGVVLLVSGDVDRVSGPIDEANDFAYLLASVLPFAVYFVLRDRRWRVWWVLCSGVLVLGLLGTLSRGALVGLAAVVLWGVATRRTRIGGLVAGVFVIAGVLVLAFTLWRPLINERLAAKNKVATANVESRKAYWEAAVAMTADKPLLGVGPGRYGVESRKYVRNDPLNLENPVVHNAYLEVLAEGGVPTFLAFLALIGGSWLLTRRARRQFMIADDRDGMRLTAAVQASLVVAIVSASFLSIQTSVSLWLLAGLAATLALLPSVPAR